MDADEEDEEEEEPQKPKAKRAAKTSPKVTMVSIKSNSGKVVSLTPQTRKPNPPLAPNNLGSVTKQLNKSPVAPPIGPSTGNSTDGPAQPIMGTVNPPGTHLHNHLKFFTTERKDAAGRPVGHPDHSTFSLKVDYKELEGVYDKCGKSLSPGQRQWWEIKSSHANCVLLFKTGKFYEMFHDDADVGVSVLGFAYMKGCDAHAGFPESAYDKFIGMLVERGYRVARVEQTETPAALAQRKKNTKGAKKPQVVAREVCGIVTRGTR